MATKGKPAVKAIDDYYTPEGDANTLMQAHKIKQDPKRHAAAKAHARSRLAAMQAVAEGAETPTEEAAESPAMEATEKRKGLER